MSIFDNEEELEKFINGFERSQADEYYIKFLSDFKVEEIHEAAIKFEPGSKTDSPLQNLVDEIHETTGLDKDELFLCFLINTSRNIGSLFPWQVEGGLIKYNANLYALLIAPPNEFAKSTIIDLDEHLTNRIDQKAGKAIVEMRGYKGIYDKGLARFSSQLKGSEEKIADLIQEHHIMHFKAKEAGPSLDVDHQKAYAEGVIQILQELYNRETYDFNFRKQSAYIPEGQYVTLFGDLHPDELNGKLLRNGLIRRMIIVKKGYEDIDLNDNSAGASFLTENQHKFSMLKNVYVSMMASFVKTIVGNSMKLVPENDIQRREREKREAKTLKKTGKELIVNNNNKLVWMFVPDANIYRITMSEEGKQWLMNIHLNARKRVKEDEVPRYPSENYELINRIAINIMLFESVYYKKYEGPFEVSVDHLEKAYAFVKRIEQGYIEEIKKIEDQPIEAKVKKLVALIEKKFNTDKEKGITWSDLLRLLKYDSQELKHITNNAIERDLISCATIVGNGRKPSLWFYPNEESLQEKIFQSLSALQDNGTIKEFSFPADLSILRGNYSYKSNKRR